MSDSDVITEENILLDDYAGTAGESNVLSAEGGTNGVPVQLKPALQDLSLRSAEAQHILQVLEMMGGNKRKAAQALKVSRSTLDRKLADMQGG